MEEIASEQLSFYTLYTPAYIKWEGGITHYLILHAKKLIKKPI